MSISIDRLQGQTQYLMGLAVFVLASLLAACGPEEAPDAARRASADGVQGADSMTIGRVLRTDRRFSTLVQALDSTGLDSVLSTAGPYTLLAPPDTAFDALPRGTVPALLTERPDRLRTILAHHVVDGRVPLRTGPDTVAVTTLGGDTLRVQRGDSARVVGAARIVDGDVEAANGLIHVIDAVLRPPPPDDSQQGGGPDAGGP
jgi:uncharacterized surface protein with fasciclin (FAS1) repeats